MDNYFPLLFARFRRIRLQTLFLYDFQTGVFRFGFTWFPVPRGIFIENVRISTGISFRIDTRIRISTSAIPTSTPCG
jgi:hypothetical protein